MTKRRRNRTDDNFPATYFIFLKAGLRFVTSLRSYKTGTSFSLAANSYLTTVTFPPRPPLFLSRISVELFQKIAHRKFQVKKMVRTKYSIIKLITRTSTPLNNRSHKLPR